MVLSKTAQLVVEAHARGYRVLPDGQVETPAGRPRKLCADARGYYEFTLKPLAGGHSSSVCVHRLVAYQKYGMAAFARGIETRHLDGNMKNNAVENIAIGTHRENIMDMTPDARRAKAMLAASRNRKLSMAQATELRADHHHGMTYADLTAKYGISKCAISYIVNKKTYR